MNEDVCNKLMLKRWQWKILRDYEVFNNSFQEIANYNDWFLYCLKNAELWKDKNSASAKNE